MIIFLKKEIKRTPCICYACTKEKKLFVWFNNLYENSMFIINLNLFNNVKTIFIVHTLLNMKESRKNAAKYFVSFFDFFDMVIPPVMFFLLLFFFRIDENFCQDHLSFTIRKKYSHSVKHVLVYINWLISWHLDRSITY